MESEPTQPARSRPKSLRELATDVRLARQNVLVHRLSPVNGDHLVHAQRLLLQAMRDYACELTARGLPVPHRLRDDLRLQGAICGHPR